MACNMNNNMGNSPINSRGCLNSRCGNTRNTNCNMNTMHNGTGCGMNRSFNVGNRQMPPSHRDSDNSTHECGCKRNEGCDRGNEPVDSMVPAMSYVPWQIWRNIYCIEEGLEKGTIFEDMDKPYIGRCGKK